MDDTLVEEIRLLQAKMDSNSLTVTECERFLDQLPRFTTKNTPEDTVRFLEYMGDPDLGMKIIHVAGTNGKGSVCNYLSSVLVKAGYKVGMFTSPHLVNINERFCIDGTPINNRLFIEIFSEVILRLDEYGEDYFPTYFEFLFLMSMVLYDVYPMDYVILETGLGGRLDATNCVRNKLISIITQIGLDHMQYLGNTYEEIAEQKAGIIKENVPVVYYDKRSESSGVIEKKAKSLNAPCHRVGSEQIYDIGFVADEKGNKFVDFSYNSEYDNYANLRLRSAAAYQVENAALAISACEILAQNGVLILKEHVIDGISTAMWAGRMELVFPGIYVDGAHNVDGVDAFLESVRNMHCEGRKLLIFGAVGDKQYDQMVERIVESALFDRISVTVLATDRSLPEDTLKGAFTESIRKHNAFQMEIRYFTNVRDALTDIIATRKAKDTVFAAGSLYLVGQIKNTY